MKTTLLLKHLGESPKIRVIDFFIGNLFGYYNKTEISEETITSRTTLQTICKELTQIGFLKKEKKGNMDLYSLNQDNILAKTLIKLSYDLNKNALEREKNSNMVGLTA